MNADILVTGNDNMNRIAYSAGLRGYGFEVVEAQTVNDAQKMRQAGLTPRAILVSARPNLDLSPLMAFIREEMGRSDIRIVVVGDVTVQGADVQFPRTVTLNHLLKTDVLVS